MAKKKEQRKYRRFQVTKSVFAGLGPYFEKVGQIIDISMGGLAFRYVGSEEPVSASHLNIIMIEPDFYLGNVRCKSVSDLAIADRVPSSSMRRTGVKFGKLTHYQKVLLGHFIQSYTTEEA